MLLCTCDGALAACTLRSGLLRPEATSHGALARWRGAPEPCASPPLGRLGKHCFSRERYTSAWEREARADVTRTEHGQPQRYKRSPRLNCCLEKGARTRLAAGLVKTQLLVFTTLFTTLFCFLLLFTTLREAPANDLYVFWHVPKRQYGMSPSAGFRPSGGGPLRKKDL